MDIYIDHPVNKDRFTELFNVPYKTKSECQVAALNMLETIINVIDDPKARALFLKEE